MSDDIRVSFMEALLELKPSINPNRLLLSLFLLMNTINIACSLLLLYFSPNNNSFSYNNFFISSVFDCFVINIIELLCLPMISYITITISKYPSDNEDDNNYDNNNNCGNIMRNKITQICCCYKCFYCNNNNDKGNKYSHLAQEEGNNNNNNNNSFLKTDGNKPLLESSNYYNNNYG